jgi:hypothetical protein
METEFLIAQGNQYRGQRQYEDALRCYSLAFSQDRTSAAAFNNYGNVLREIGEAKAAIPFLNYAAILDPTNVTAQFNLAVAHLLLGDYARGWPAYESRWQYEHLAGTLPQFTQPRWQGQDLKGKTILVVGEQGHGDNIQFSRFLWNLHVMGAEIKLQVTQGLIPMFAHSTIIKQVGGYDHDMGPFDYWVPIMSLPGLLNITLDNLARPVSYLNARDDLVKDWLHRLGAKNRLRVGFAWSGRPDSWLNQHKGMPFEHMLELIKNNPGYEWINLQIDATPDQEQQLESVGVRRFPGSITGFHDTAALVMHLDVVLSVDTAVAHLSGALGRPTWIMLQKFAQDWRWLLDRSDSPWYSSARLFRQANFDDWQSVTDRVSQYLSWFKV